MTHRSSEPASLHEFKNHLALIRLYSQLLLKTLPANQVRADVTLMLEASTAMQGLLPELARHYRQQD
jgi:nitrogen-specific signal transduction histidine kinase